MICGGHVQASFPFFFILIFFSLSLFFSSPLFHSSSPPTMYSVHLLRYFNSPGAEFAPMDGSSDFDIRSSAVPSTRYARSRTTSSKADPCLAPHHSGVELYSHTPRIRGTGCGGLGLTPPSSGLQFSLQTIPLTSHHPPLSLPFTPFPLLKPSVSLSPPTIRLLGQSILPLIPTRSPASPFHLPCSNRDVLPFYPSTTFTRLP